MQAKQRVVEFKNGDVHIEYYEAYMERWCCQEVLRKDDGANMYKGIEWAEGHLMFLPYEITEI